MIMNEVEQKKKDQEGLKALMASEIEKNKDRAYEDMVDVNELIASYKEAGGVESMAMVKY